MEEIGGREPEREGHTYMTAAKSCQEMISTLVESIDELLCLPVS